MELLKKYIKRNIFFVILLFALLFLELFVFNHHFFVNYFHGLNEQHFSVDEGSAYGFIIDNGKLIAEHEDPNITLHDIDQRIRYVSVSCTNANQDALSQIFFRGKRGWWTEENSVIFPMDQAITTISLPRTQRIASLRLDLTNKEGDILTCERFTINPQPSFNFSFIRLGLVLFSVLGLFYGEIIIPQKYSNSIWTFVIKDYIWIFILLLILINYSLPVTIAFDSGHYLWLADLVITGEWVTWDPFRTIGFPLFIAVSLGIFGYNLNALLLPMILAHVILFIFCCHIVLNLFSIRKQFIRVSLISVIFIFIALDPTIIGFFHTLLTEYVVATIAVASSFFALQIYKSPLFSKRFYASTAFFLVMAPISWHIKQPYIGAALFPFLIVCILLIIRDCSWKATIFGIVTNISILIIVLISTSGWNSFLENQGNPLDDERLISTLLERTVSSQTTSIETTPSNFLADQLSNYFTIINLEPRPSPEIETKYALTYGFQNDLIAHRMFTNRGKSNLFYHHPPFDQYTRFFIETYSPPRLIYFMSLVRLRLSHFLFTTTNLLLPLFFLGAFLYWIRKKNAISTALLLLVGTSLLNIIAHLLIWPIDRYLFLGYPLNLLLLIIVFMLSGQKYIQHINN